jgi:N6-L-threonylcarbamoyladenine synthase
MQDGKILSNIISTQKIHELYGGVVPELASRAHQSNIIPVVSQALAQANVSLSQIQAIAYTKGPGLLGSLLVGACFAKSMSLVLDVPLVEVHHLHAHIFAHFIDEPKPNFPFLCLTVSGGHTQIVLIEDFGKMKILGETQDDAVGEAFDKTAKLMGLPYPGGALIDKYAQQGNPNAFVFPLVEMPNLDYSFSGIKTAFLNFFKKNTANNPNFIQENLNDICASVQKTLIDILLKKLKIAIKQTNIKEVAIAGGVSANSGLRNSLQKLGEEENLNVYIPAFQYCTDNAGMVAMAGYLQYLRGDFGRLDSSPEPRMGF